MVEMRPADKEAVADWVQVHTAFVVESSQHCAVDTPLEQADGQALAEVEIPAAMDPLCAVAFVEGVRLVVDIDKGACAVAGWGTADR
jgi:hypothetical protein